MNPANNWVVCESSEDTGFYVLDAYGSVVEYFLTEEEAFNYLNKYQEHGLSH